VVGRSVDTGETFVDEGAHRRIPIAAIGDVDRELLTGLGDLHGAARQTEATGLAIEGEDVDAVTERQHQRGLRTVGDEARRKLRRAALMEGERQIVRRGHDREDRADRHVEVNVGGTVERIDRDADPGFTVADLRLAHLFGRERCDRQLAEAAAQDRIRLHVEIALDVTVAVAAGAQARGVGEIAGGDEIGDLDRCCRNGIDCGRHGERVGRRLGITLKVVVQPELPGHLRPSPCGRRIQFPPRRRSVAVSPSTRRLTAPT